MAGTINYLFDPNQTVWVIAPCAESLTILEGVVVRVRGEVLTSTTVSYDIRIGDSAGTERFEEADVFASLVDAGNEYVARLEV